MNLTDEQFMEYFKVFFNPSVPITTDDIPKMKIEDRDIIYFINFIIEKRMDSSYSNDEIRSLLRRDYDNKLYDPDDYLYRETYIIQFISGKIKSAEVIESNILLEFATYLRNHSYTYEGYLPQTLIDKFILHKKEGL